MSWSPTAEKMLGYSAREATGKYCYEIIAGGDYQGHRFCRRNCPIITNARRGRPTDHYDVLARTKDGGRLWINMSIAVPPSPNPKGIAAVHLFRDISRRRRAEELAKATLSTLETLLPMYKDNSADLDPYPVPAPNLTRREMEVLRLLAGGMDTRQVAQELDVSYTTARNHIEHIITKLGVKNRLQAVVYASRHHLL